MNRLRDTLHASTGLMPSDADLERALRDAPLPVVQAAVRGDYAPLPGTPEFEALVDQVVVPESWMLRDPAVFAEALRFVQRRLAARPQRPVRILSVPCAGGLLQLIEPAQLLAPGVAALLFGASGAAA